MKALVTGAGGFVGANLIRHLLAAGHETIGAIRPGGNRWRVADLQGSVALVELDLRDPTAIEREVQRLQPEVIFHLAAYGAYSWQRDLDVMLSVNVRATEALLDGARSVGARFVNAGSSSEYGYRSKAPSEFDRVEPNSHYAVTKATATHLCRFAAQTHGQTAITLRLYSVYGPWEEPKRLMPTLIVQALEGRWPPLAEPTIARDFVWVGDACSAFIRAASANVEDPGAIFNIASGRQTTLRDLVEVARQVFEVEEEPTWGTSPARDWDTSTWVGNATSATHALSWRATTPLDRGLETVGEWFRANPILAHHYKP
jgi:nucleoside-diphosphate-sugar epimerase